MFGRYWKTMDGTNRHFVHCQWIRKTLFVTFKCTALRVHIPARLSGVASRAKDAEKNHLQSTPPKIASTRSQMMVPMTVAVATSKARP